MVDQRKEGLDAVRGLLWGIVLSLIGWSVVALIVWLLCCR